MARGSQLDSLPWAKTSEAPPQTNGHGVQAQGKLPDFAMADGRRSRVSVSARKSSLLVSGNWVGWPQGVYGSLTLVAPPRPLPEHPNSDNEALDSWKIATLPSPDRQLVPGLESGTCDCQILLVAIGAAAASL